MPEQSIVCPSCGEKFPLTDLLRTQIEEQLRTKLGTEFSKKEQAFKIEAEKRDRELQRKERALKEEERALEEKVEEGVKDRLQEIRAKAKKDALEEVSSEMKERDQRLEALEGKLEAARKTERELRHRTKELDDRAKEMDLEVERKLETRQKEVEEKVRAEEAEKSVEKLATKDEELRRLRDALDRAQRVGVSGELSGEVAEKTLEERLLSTFREDKVVPIPRGEPGADVEQKLGGGGSILWESKDHYPKWQKIWVTKLVKDRDEAGASVGILVTHVGPENKTLRGLMLHEGVVLTPPSLVIGVASLLRPQVEELARQRRLYDKKETLQEAVYAWATSDDFKKRATAIAKGLKELQEQVAGARKNVGKWFTNMERAVERTERSITEFYSTARSHATLPDLKVLELTSGSGSDGTETAGDEESEDDHAQ